MNLVNPVSYTQPVTLYQVGDLPHGMFPYSSSDEWLLTPSQELLSTTSLMPWMAVIVPSKEETIQSNMGFTQTTYLQDIMGN